MTADAGRRRLYPMPRHPACIGPYCILGPLGEGGMGVVYRGQHQETGAAVALKTVRVVRA